MTRLVGLDVSQKMTAICVVDNAGRRLWRGQCPTVPEQISVLVRPRRTSCSGMARPYTHRHGHGRWVRICRDELSVPAAGSPKKRGPDQCAPVIFLAILVRGGASEPWGRDG
jgi:hypothetical protein